jgi:hypothetical protein
MVSAYMHVEIITFRLRLCELLTVETEHESPCRYGLLVHNKLSQRYELLHSKTKSCILNMDEQKMEKGDEDGMVESLFGESPLGLSKTKRQTTAGERTSGGDGNTDNRNIENIDNVKKKLIVDDDVIGERRGVPGGVPVASTAEEGMLVEEDLYGDLYVDDDHGSGKRNDGSGILRLKVSKLTSDVAAKDAVISEAEKVIQSLRETVSRLERENETLKYNISSLFNTAKLEIERKDREIEENRSEIYRLKKKGGRS